MMLRIKIFFAALGALGLLGCASPSTRAQTCASMERVKNNGEDATPAISNCVKNQSGEGTLRLLPGTYRLLTPLVIDRAVTIETYSASPRQVCSKETGANCAILEIGRLSPQPSAGVMPIEVTAQNVTLRAIAIIGSGNGDGAWQRRICLDQNARPLGGGIRVRADGFQMTNILLKGASCYTALEITKGVKGAVISGNVIGPNGNHSIKDMWSDGITFHDAISAVVERNIFKDNTDVQLIFGGCISCRIKNNRFTHSKNFVHASFAELMLHAWPDTSGNFSNSMISGNSIDCGTERRCGYGIMIGGEPWYPSKAFGGTVSGNYVTNALMGINIDKLTGHMEIKNNLVFKSGGIAKSDCGTKKWPSVNVSPESEKFLLDNDMAYSSVKTTKCIINRDL